MFRKSVQKNPSERGIFYKFFSKCFNYPDEQLVELIGHGALLEIFELTRVNNRSRREFQEWIARENNQADMLEALRVEYTRLFINHFPHLPAPLYQSFYLEQELYGTVTGEIQDIYHKNGFTLSRQLREPPDHLAIALEFMYRLIEGERDEAVQELFLRKHLLSWIELLSERVHDSAKLPFYPLITDGLLVFLKQDSRALNNSGNGLLYGNPFRRMKPGNS